MAIRNNDPDGMRQKILDAAFEAFTREGYSVTSIHSLREDAAVSGGAFSHHFPTKKLLGLAVIRDRVAEAIEETWIKRVTDAPDAVTGIDRAVEAIADEIDRKKTVSGCPLGNLAAELSVQDVDFRREMQPLYTRWREAISKKLMSDGERKPVDKRDPKATATMIVASISGAMAMAKVSQNSEPLRQTWAEARRFLRITPPE